MSLFQGCGLGLRREFIDEICFSKKCFKPDWWEVTPENWIDAPIWYQDKFEEISEKSNLVAHGVSLSLGSNKKPPLKFLKKLKHFLDSHKIEYYSEHISFSSYDNLQAHELLPVPLTLKMLDNMCDNVKYVQDFLGRNLSLENASYYYVPKAKMSESDFINQLIDKTNSKMLLDVNNVYVNSINHGFNAKEYIKSMPLDKVSYIHVAGHYYDRRAKMLIDSHGTNVNDDTWDLLDFTLKRTNASPMIERDNHIPTLKELKKEYKMMDKIYKKRVNNEKY